MINKLPEVCYERQRLMAMQIGTQKASFLR